MFTVAKFYRPMSLKYQRDTKLRGKKIPQNENQKLS